MCDTFRCATTAAATLPGLLWSIVADFYNGLLFMFAVNGLTKSALEALRASMALEELLLEVRRLGWEEKLSCRRLG